MTDKPRRPGVLALIRAITTAGAAVAIVTALAAPPPLRAARPDESPQSEKGGGGGGGEKNDEKKDEKKKDGDEKKRVVYKVVDRDQNRYVVGDPQKFERPAQIDILQVLSKIPAYQQIVKEKLTDKDPRYYFLLQEATKTLVSAAEIVTRKAGYDLVADIGAIEAEGGEIPDLTEAVIEALKK